MALQCDVMYSSAETPVWNIGNDVVRETGAEVRSRETRMPVLIQIKAESTVIYSRVYAPGRNVVLIATANVVAERSHALEDWSRDLARTRCWPILFLPAPSPSGPAFEK